MSSKYICVTLPLFVVSALVIIIGALSMTSCGSSHPHEAASNVTPAVAHFHAEKGVVISTRIQATQDRYGCVSSDRQIIFKIDGKRIPLSTPSECLLTEMDLDIAFVADFDTMLSEDYDCRKYLRKACVRIVEAFEFGGDRLRDRAKFTGTDCTGYGGWKDHPNWPLNEIWKCAEKRGRRDDARNLAYQISEIAEQIDPSPVSRRPCIVILRWQPEPFELSREDELYFALETAREAKIPVSLIIFGQEPMLADGTRMILYDLGVKPFLLYVPGECPSGRIEWGDDVEDQLARFTRYIKRLRSTYLLEYISDKVFIKEDSHSIELGLTEAGLDEEDVSFDKRPIDFSESSSHRARLWGLTLAIIVLAGFSMSFPMYSIAVVTGKSVRYFGREGADQRDN